MTKDYNSRKQDRNFYRYIHIYVLKKIRENYYVISNIFLFYFYSSNNQGNRGGQSPSINTNNKNSNSISEKSTGLWDNWQTRGTYWTKNGEKVQEHMSVALLLQRLKWTFFWKYFFTPQLHSVQIFFQKTLMANSVHFFSNF